MECYLAQSGSAPLNFDVKAYASEALLLAATPKENTIGIITTTPIAKWTFAAERPEVMTDGEVWISSGISSPVEFNALKKGGIQVYPLYAKQMVSGELKDVPAKSYQNGEWVDWISYLFKHGDECVKLTGGWVVGTWLWQDGDVSHAGEYSIGETMTLTATHGANCLSLRTANKINLKPYSKIRVSLNASGSTNNRNFVISNSTTGVISQNIPLPDTDFDIDISGYSDSYYIGVLVRHGSSASIAQISLLR